VFGAAIALWLAACGALAYVRVANASTRGLALFFGLALILIASVARGTARRRDEDQRE
jgi:hypothetical protein